MVEEPLEDLESENIKTWQKLHRGHAIVAAGEDQRISDFVKEALKL